MRVPTKNSKDLARYLMLLAAYSMASHLKRHVAMFPHPRHQLLQCCSAACCINTRQEKNWPRCCRQWWPDMQVMFDDVAFRRNVQQNFCTLLRHLKCFISFIQLKLGCCLSKKKNYQQAVGLTKCLLKP